MATCLPCLPGRGGVTPQGPVNLNVGGARFAVSRATLASCPSGSALRRLIDSPPESDGSYFLDRDGRHFHHVLNFLRDGPEHFVRPREEQACRELHREANILGLPELAAATSNVYCGAPLPANEDERLARIEDLNIMHSDPSEHHYDSITRIVGAILDVPIVLVSIVGKEHQWFKSKCGLTADSTPRHTSFCAFTFKPEVPKAASMLLIEDATKDPRTAENPLVIGEPHIVFYAGCPLVTSDGIRLGALCAIDRVPRALTPLQAQVLVNFTQITAQEIEREQLSGRADCVMEDVDLASADFAGGPLRVERMREATTEMVCFIQVQSGDMEWPILYANKTWTDVTGLRVMPPSKIGSKTVGSRQSENKQLLLWDLLSMPGKKKDKLQRDLASQLKRGEAKTFAISAVLKTAPTAGAGGVAKEVSVVCRFTPADEPLDVAAAAIQAVPCAAQLDGQGQAITSYLYFVSLIIDDSGPRDLSAADDGREPAPRDQFARYRGSSSTELGEAPSRMDLPRSLSESQVTTPRTTREKAIEAIKPPKSPFVDVRLVRLVGEGSFGKVYYGLWMGSPVAVKIIETQGSSEFRKVEPIFEATVSVAVTHPHLVQTYKYSTREKNAMGVIVEAERPDAMEGCNDAVFETWIVQEWCDRGTLGKLCSTPRNDEDSIPEVLDICAEIAGAGSYLHSRGIIHGDLSANNVLIKSQVSRKGYVCKLCDFGLAHVLEGNDLEVMTTKLGTVTHMPPELFNMDTPHYKLTTKADVYAAGILLWQAIKGESPFAGLSGPQVVLQVANGRRLKLPEDTPASIRAMFDRCTAANPEDRPEFDELVEFFLTARTKLDCRAPEANA